MFGPYRPAFLVIFYFWSVWPRVRYFLEHGWARASPSTRTLRAQPSTSEPEHGFFENGFSSSTSAAEHGDFSSTAEHERARERGFWDQLSPSTSEHARRARALSMLVLPEFLTLVWPVITVDWSAISWAFLINLALPFRWVGPSCWFCPFRVRNLDQPCGALDQLGLLAWHFFWQIVQFGPLGQFGHFGLRSLALGTDFLLIWVLSIMGTYKWLIIMFPF